MIFSNFTNCYAKNFWTRICLSYHWIRNQLPLLYFIKDIFQVYIPQIFNKPTKHLPQILMVHEKLVKQNICHIGRVWCHTWNLLTMLSHVRENNSIYGEHPMRLGKNCSLIYSLVWKLWPEFLGILKSILDKKWPHRYL